MWNKKKAVAVFAGVGSASFYSSSQFRLFVVEFRPMKKSAEYSAKQTLFICLSNVQPICIIYRGNYLGIFSQAGAANWKNMFAKVIPTVIMNRRTFVYSLDMTVETITIPAVRNMREDFSPKLTATLMQNAFVGTAAPSCSRYNLTLTL